jgi:endonuclease-8
VDSAFTVPGDGKDHAIFPSMEGPSLVIACEEFASFLRKKIRKVSGTASIPLASIEGSHLIGVRSWGKHFILVFPKTALRIHFLMFGSYRIDDPRENRIPKLLLDYGKSKIYFYSCAIKELTKGWKAEYDWSVDLMSPKWDPSKALKSIRARPNEQVADLLMDQKIFSGLGNIMKNETLFNLRMHPETRVGELTPLRQRALVREAERYAWQFYEWKKQNVLKRNWKIMRKKVCPRCSGKVTKKVTGKLKRWSHFCSRCQLR